MKSYISKLKKQKIKGLFITATDTDAGKTTVAVTLLQALNASGFSTVAIKPIASGCHMTPNGLRSDDALKLQQASSLKIPYQHVNPVALAPPIAPHIAAAEQGISLNAASLYTACQPALEYAADMVIVEGAGGFLCPLNDNETLADLAVLFNFPILCIIPIKLGCLNQSLMLLQAVAQHDVPLFGCHTNCFGEMIPRQEENIRFIQRIFAKALR